MNPQVLAEYLDVTLPGFEGTSPTMYLDTDGNVTVGCGEMLPNAIAAQRLPFFTKTSAGIETQSNPARIASDFSMVSRMKPGLRPIAYYFAQASYLKQPDIDALTAGTIAIVQNEVRTAFPNIDLWPDTAQLAIVDMAYNVGIGKLVREFTHLRSACIAKRWWDAATTCHRLGIQPARNTWTAEQFKAAAMAVTSPSNVQVA